jgi:predicted ester cyclase
MGEARELVDRAWSAIETGDFDTLGKLFDQDAEVSTSAGAGRGRDFAVRLFQRHKSGYPDLRHEVVDGVESAAGDAVALRIVFTATHQGTLRGPFGLVEPTGRPLTWRTSDHVRVRGGAIVSWHAHFDRLTLLQQLGQTPPAPAAADGKAVIRRILDEVFGEGRVDVLDDVLTPGFVNHRVPPGMDSGGGSVKRIVRMEREAFPDLTYTVDHEVQEGDLVVSVTTAEGTHLGEAFGVPPTGRRVRWQQVHIARIEDGRMAEHWGVSDLASLWVQIGRTPPVARVRPAPDGG